MVKKQNLFWFQIFDRMVTNQSNGRKNKNYYDACVSGATEILV